MPTTRRQAAQSPQASPQAAAADTTGSRTANQQQQQHHHHHPRDSSGDAKPDRGKQSVQIDESGPLVFAVGNMGPAYWDWLDHPVSGQPRFFAADALEACSKVVWWVVPAIWLPIATAVAFAALRALAGDAAAALDLSGFGQDPHHNHQQQNLLISSLLGHRSHHHQQPQRHSPLGGAAAPPPPLWRAAPQLLLLQLAGVALWQLLEYCIHRFGFHARGDGYWAVTIHFLFHGNHHKFPMDHERLVFPPLPAALIAALIYGAIRAALPAGAALGLMSGVLFGYTAYDVTHYLLHHGGKLPGSYLAELRRRHAHHHYQSGAAGFQISSPLFDVVFGTRADLGGGGGGGRGGKKGAAAAREERGLDG
jgi:hypothetical protein